MNLDTNRSRIDSATHTIHFERTIDASPERVFDSWTKAENVSQWWDPSGKPLVACTIDLRVGGSFRFVTDGHAPPFEGTYKTLERPAKLVFEALGSVGTVSIEKRGGKTHLHVSIRCASAEHLAQFQKIGVDQGTNVTLDNLAAFAAKAPN
ncbi:MAG: SRPBCC domain-containing protein [Polyangiaceae bacterium]